MPIFVTPNKLLLYPDRTTRPRPQPRAEPRPQPRAEPGAEPGVDTDDLEELHTELGAAIQRYLQAINSDNNETSNEEDDVPG